MKLNDEISNESGGSRAGRCLAYTVKVEEPMRGQCYLKGKPETSTEPGVKEGQLRLTKNTSKISFLGRV